MKDLDQFLLKEIAISGPAYQDERGVLHVIVPRDLLARVTADFDVEHVRKELRGSRH